jgi:hypothetical protein
MIWLPCVFQPALPFTAIIDRALKLSGASVGFKLKQKRFAFTRRTLAGKSPIHFTVLNSNLGFNSNSKSLKRASVGPPE